MPFFCQNMLVNRYKTVYIVVANVKTSVKTSTFSYKEVCPVSLEAIKSISEAEEDARQAKIRAQQKARESAEDVEKTGKEAVASSITRAESEIANLKRVADQKASEQAVELASTTANKQATLRARAESRFDRAAQLIVERIVKV